MATSVNLGPFEDIGFLADKPQVRSIISRMGMNFVPKHYALKTIENAIVMGMTQVGIFDIDWHRWLSQMRFEEVPMKLRSIIADVKSEEEGTGRGKIDILKELDRASPGERQALIETYICTLLAVILGTEVSTIDPTINLASQGLDSLSSIELALSIQGDTNLNMTPEEFGAVRSVRSVAKLILAKYQAMREVT